MSTYSIKNVKETNLNESEKQVEILFESSQDGIKTLESVTLSGEGSVKVLLPV